MVRWRYWSKTKIIAQECTWWGEGIDPKHFVSLLYISVAIKASLLKFSMFSVHKNTISNIFLEFSNFKVVGLVQIGILNFFAVASSGWGKGADSKLFHHVLLCEVKVLIQTFLFHRVLGEVKI